MFNKVERLSPNISGKQKKKKQIILTNTGRDVEEYLTSLKYRMNGKFKRIPHYIVTKDGKIIQTLPDEAYSNYFTEPNVNRNSIIISFENLGWLEKVPLKDYYTNWTGSWLKVEPTVGAVAVENLYQELLAGRVDPTIGHVCSMRS